ncbi:MAG: hypothetical protein KC423_20705, partial [Anaerolineales bacterium]|nr:hypothetical protein [Anaerolineales bacterium]
QQTTLLTGTTIGAVYGVDVLGQTAVLVHSTKVTIFGQTGSSWAETKSFPHQFAGITFGQPVGLMPGWVLVGTPNDNAVYVYPSN